MKKINEKISAFALVVLLCVLGVAAVALSAVVGTALVMLAAWLLEIGITARQALGVYVALITVRFVFYKSHKKG
ncbi:MAG: hypothetical protein UDB11_00560 [Peptococcaceae bacterium]|nr:hypothetical protein [Peptococcaceae bacterium]